MTTLRVVHYLNQFFAGIGAEDKADTPPGNREGPVGPGRVLQQILGDRGEVVATVYCGDNYAGEQRGAIDEILGLVAKYRPDILIAGPAFAAGRYGLACGEVTLRARELLGVTAVTGMHVDNAATEVYRTRLHIASTQRTAAGMADALATMARLALKLAAGTTLGSPADEGYVPTGRRVFEVAEQPAPLRAVEMLLRKVRGELYTTEWPVPLRHQVAQVFHRGREHAPARAVAVGPRGLQHLAHQRGPAPGGPARRRARARARGRHRAPAPGALLDDRQHLGHSHDASLRA